MMRYATTTAMNLKITDKQGLLDFINANWRPRNRKPFCMRELEAALEWTVPMEDLFIEENGTLHFNIDKHYNPSIWSDLAPFLEGCIEWRAEGGNLWRDIFCDGTLTEEFPVVLWPSEYFHLELWSDEDIIWNAEEMEIELTDDQLSEVRKRLTSIFSDHSLRNEQIAAILEEYQ